MRQILRIDVGGVPLVGTYHRPERMFAAVAPEMGPPAVLLLNFGQVCRSGPGNISVAMADRLCGSGYPVFRFDLPGLGDTPGDLPQYHETYWCFVEDGGQTQWVCGLMDALQHQYAAPGFVLGGLCGGAVTSILVAERRRASVLGLILMEPAIRRTPPIYAETMPGTVNVAEGDNVWAGFQARGARARHRVKLWIRGTNCLNPLRRAYRAARRGLWDRHVRFPVNANAMLIRCWRKVEASGLPMLAMMTPSADRDLVKQVLFPEAHRRRITIADLDDTNHLFLTGDGRQRAINEAERWMRDTYRLGASRGCGPAGHARSVIAEAVVSGGQ